MSRALAFEAFAGRTLTLQLFEDVANAAELKRRIVAKELPVEAAFLDADSVPHIFLVHLAAFKALAAQVRRCGRSRGAHAQPSRWCDPREVQQRRPQDAFGLRSTNDRCCSSAVRRKNTHLQTARLYQRHHLRHT